MTERERIQDLAVALKTRVGRDPAGDPCIWGRCDPARHLENNIHVDGRGYSLMVSMPTRRKLTAALEHLAFCTVRQRGDREAVLYLDRLPTKQESWVIRRYLGIRKVAELSPEEAAARRARICGINRRRRGNEVQTA